MGTVRSVIRDTRWPEPTEGIRILPGQRRMDRFYRGPARQRPKLRRRRLFDTTNTLEKAMAAPATSGLR